MKSKTLVFIFTAFTCAAALGRFGPGPGGHLRHPQRANCNRDGAGDRERNGGDC